MTKHKPRPTIYKGIQMRSRLEAGFAAWLDGRHIKWQYEPCAFADEKGQYLPDFELLEFDITSLKGDMGRVFIEVKPDGFMDESSANYERDKKIIDRQADILHASDPQALFFLAKPSGVWWLDGCHISAAWILGRGRTELAIQANQPWDDEYWKSGA